MTVILAAGDFPRKGTTARALLERATRVVCCDGAADRYWRCLGRDPAVVVGDGDSLKGRFPAVVREAEQETNDLEKAFRLCARNGWKDVVVLGATGRREDHTLGNLFRAMARGVVIVTDYGRFVPIVRRVTLRVSVGTAISIFATPGTRMSSTGLAWPLKDVQFENLYCATLNRATCGRVTLRTTRRAYAFVAS